METNRQRLERLGMMDDETIMEVSQEAARLRFSERDIHHAMLRLGLVETEGREEAVHILREWDRGHGDVDDVIDCYENAPAY